MSTKTRFVDVLLICRDLVKIIGEEGKLAYPVSIKEAILPLVERMLSGEREFKVTLHQKEWRSANYYSMLKRYDDSAKITYSSDLNTCWKRMAICKEIAHLLIDCKPCHRTTDGVALIQELITNAPVMQPESPLESEWMGVVAAIEILLPWELRGELSLMKSAGKTDYEIAEYCRVPEKYVNVILSSNYGATSARMNQELDAAMPDPAAA